LNFTPTSTAAESAMLGLAGVAEDAQIVQGAQLRAAGVIEFDALEAGPVPTAFVAETVNVYAVPLVRPFTVALVAGGLPDTVVGDNAVDPAYGVTV
jgi:hypothetical protein